MKREGVLVDFNVSTLWIADEHANRAPTGRTKRVVNTVLMDATPKNATHLSVAKANFAIESSSVLAFLESRGVPMLDAGVESTRVDVPSVVPPSFALAACFAAFSARRFCLDADGGIVKDRQRYLGRKIRSRRCGGERVVDGDQSDL